MMGVYTHISRVESELQLNIDSDSHPNETEVEAWITEVDAEIDARSLWKYHVVSGLFDVPPIEGAIAEETAEWLDYITKYGYDLNVGQVVVPDLAPIISIDVSGCHRRTIGLGTAATWQVLQEGFANQFLILKKKTKAGQYLGFAIYFFENPPYAGVQTLRLTYYYGYNINRKILQKYATKRVAIEVLKAKMGRSEPAGLTQYRGGDFQTFVASNFEERITRLESECEYIEERFFPTDPVGIGMVII